MNASQLQDLEYTLLAAAQAALKEAHDAPITKAIVAPARASRALEEAANAVREWRQAQTNADGTKPRRCKDCTDLESCGSEFCLDAIERTSRHSNQLQHGNLK